LFIRVGWLASLGGIGALPFVDSGRAVTIAFVAALVLGMVVSFGYHQAFRDPRKYTDRAMFVLGVMSTINTHVAILFFGAFTLAPLLIVIGLHFIGRSELSMRRPVVVTACACHASIALALITGLFSDPGVFATERPLGTVAHLIGAIYVQAAYVLAYVTGQNQRRSSLRSIEQLQRATRIASQRAALLDELRADLARAQQIGTGRYTGQVVGGFRLGMIIGRGAHGEVYDATQIADGAVAAVKLLHRDQLMDPTAIARFLREVRATASLDAPNIVRVLATSEPDAALPFMAMEKLSGLTLAEQLRRTPTLSPVDASTLVTHVAAGLDAARAAGIVHRDLKPQNLLCAGGIWKVLDFGVASLGDLTGTLTKGGVVGTPQYMAPEQARGARIDHRADLYALGAIAYRVLTGRNAFSGADTPALLYAVVHTMPVAPSSLADLPPDVDRWLALAMAKDPEARWPTGSELAEQFARALRGELSDQVRADAAHVLHMTPWRGSAA
jgi:serine/threonine-protein kinase